MKNLKRKSANILTQAKRYKNEANSQLAAVDRILGGAIISNPVVQAVAPYANMAGRAIDYFDTLLNVNGNTSHPQIAAGTSAGVSQTIGVNRSKPKITGSRGNITITHKELVGEVTMVSAVATNPTTTTGQSAFTLSPTNTSLVPWLSTIAGAYDYFKFNRVRLVYVPLCSTSTTGRVMLGYDPDATDSLAYDRQGLSSYSCSSDGSAWGVMSLDCKLPTNQPWYQSNNITTLAQYATSSMGQVFWSTWAGAGTSTVGELYILYDITLKDPQPTSLNVFVANGNGATVLNNFEFNSPASLSSTATSIVVFFVGAGTYTITISAKTTAATGAQTLGMAGGASVIGGGAGQYHVGDGTDMINTFQVNVTNSGYSTAPGTITSPATATVAGLAGLGAYTVNVIKTERLVAYPTVP